MLGIFQNKPLFSPVFVSETKTWDVFIGNVGFVPRF